jgi:hypothetical protein
VKLKMDFVKAKEILETIQKLDNDSKKLYLYLLTYSSKPVK